MPSSFSFLLSSESSNSSSSSENDSKSDQSDDNDNENNISYYKKKRTIQNDNDMLERPSDHDDSYSQTDDSDNDEKENDPFISSNNSRSYFLTRQLTLYENDWPDKTSLHENKFQKSFHRDDTSLLDLNQQRRFSPERSKSVSIVDKKHQSRNIHPSLPSDFAASAQELHTISQSDNMPTLSSIFQTKTNISPSPNEDTQRPISKIPIRTHSTSQSRSRSPTIKTITHRHIQSPIISSKIPVPLPTPSKGAFHFFTSDDRPSPSQLPPIKDSTQISTKSTQQLSPFTPINHGKTHSLSKQTSSSAGNTPSSKYHRSRLATSDDEDDDDDSETNNLKEVDLKLKLKEEKRHGKKTGELLNKLHENYEELLEKYAQAENTIDQLRFQPRIYGDNTPSSNASEGTIHFIHQPKINMTTLPSNGVYHTSSGTPVSSTRQVPSTTTTTTTPAIKSTSPANSGTIESIFFDEPVSQKIIITSETIKLDLLLQTKTLSEKMKSFLTLMDANQLSLAEQKQVYESIKEDYEKLLKTIDRKQYGNDFNLDGDLNQELETMKQLLKEIVKRITDNLLGKSINGSETGRHSHLTRDGSQSSQLSVRSSLCNHDDLMDQYKKLLNAVNTEVHEKKDEHHHSSQSDVSPPTTKNPKPYVNISGNSDDDEQQQKHNTIPISSIKRIDSTSFNLDYIPSTSIKHHQQLNEEQTHIHGITKPVITKKKKSSNKQDIQEYDNLENLTKTKRKTKLEQKKYNNYHQTEKDLSPSTVSIPTGAARYSTNSMRTRTSDYDSGIGTNNTTKLSRDRLNTSTIDESHYQSLDEERRRYSDEEQESMLSVSSSSSRSSGSGATNPRIISSKYTKRFNSSSSLKQLNENCRRKPSGNSDIYQSDIETHRTGSFDPLPPSSSFYRKNSRRNHHSWTPQRTISYQSRLTPYHRSVSIENLNQSSRPQTAPQISLKTSQYYPMGRKYQSGFIESTSKYPDNIYKSSFYIDQAHTHRRSQEKLHQNQRHIQTSKNLYMDSQTGIIYRYIPNQTQPSTINYYQPNSQVKSSSRDLYQCAECGSITTYRHRHHINSYIRRIPTDIDDPGYESGNRIIHQQRRYIEHLTSSDSDVDENPTNLDISILNEAYERAKKVQYRSQNLSKNISRQLKLVLATI